MCFACRDRAILLVASTGFPASNREKASIPLVHRWSELPIGVAVFSGACYQHKKIVEMDWTRKLRERLWVSTERWFPGEKLLINQEK